MNRDIVKVLTNARKLIKAPYGFAKESFDDITYGKDGKPHQCYCAVGAIRAAVADHLGVNHNYADTHEPLRSQSVALLVQSIDSTLRIEGNDFNAIEGLVYDWNDAKATTKAQVVEVFDTAILLAKNA